MTNNINTIYSTVSGGKTHIAADMKYVGSVDSYNNCFTRFFAWLFCLSISVNFDGKVRSVNKKDYTNLICTLMNVPTINNISQYSIFRSVAEKVTLPTHRVKMRDVITSNDRQTLHRKLAIAISRGDTTKALLMIGKGAELDSPYFDRERLDPSFTDVRTDLNPNSRYQFIAFYAAPILQAARKGNIAVCRYLETAGANLHPVRGNQYTFHRVIENVDRNLELTWEPTWVPHHHHTRDEHGHRQHSVRYGTDFRPGLRERTIVTTRDSKSHERNFQLDPNGYTVVEI